jgi:hypothetical protein
MYLEKAGGIEQAKKNIELAVEKARNGSSKRYNVTSPRSIASFIANLPKEDDKKVKVKAI